MRLARLGAAGPGGAGRGVARQGAAGEARRGAAWRGMAWRGLAWHGAARLGLAGLGEAGMAGQGTARHGEARQARFQSLTIWSNAMQVKWKNGSQFRAEAGVAHKTIEEIRNRNGGAVAADDVVHAAKAKRSPLHDDFEWDDSKAAHEHRLETARRMLRSFVIVRTELKTDRPQRAYEVVREPQDGKHRIKHVYKTVDDIMKDTDLRAELLGRALGELISIRNRYRDLQELAVVLRAIDEVVGQFSA